MDEALQNAPEAITLFSEALSREGRSLPAPRRLSALKNDPAFAADLQDHMVALISVPEPILSAAE
jgi:hypothetical protein